MKAHVSANQYLSSQQLNSIKQDIKREVKEELVKIGDRLFMDELATILFVLHNEFGFGEKRLKRFVDTHSTLHEELRERYELGADEDGWICTKKLQNAGIDLESLYEKVEPRYKR